jgi:hypothetical protein
MHRARVVVIAVVAIVIVACGGSALPPRAAHRVKPTPTGAHLDTPCETARTSAYAFRASSRRAGSIARAA